MGGEFKYDDTALRDAEETAAIEVFRALGVRPGVEGFISVFPGRADCAVFDIGHLHIGDQTAFPATCYCFRGNLDLYNRSRPDLQRWISRLLVAFPATAHNGRRPEPGGRVLVLRIAKESGAVGQISSVDVTLQPQGTAAVHTASVAFDVVFSIAPPEPGGETPNQE